MSKIKLPHWDLTPIFPSTESSEYREALSSIATLSSRVKEQVNSHAPLYDIIMTLNELESVQSTLNAYTSALLTTDTSNPAYIKAVGEVENASLLKSEAENLFALEIGSFKAEFEDVRLSEYRYFLEHTLEDSMHRMTLAEESLADDLARSGADAWARLFDTVSSSISDGEKTVIQLRNDANSADRELEEPHTRDRRNFGRSMQRPLLVHLMELRVPY